MNCKRMIALASAVLAAAMCLPSAYAEQLPHEEISQSAEELSSVEVPETVSPVSVELEVGEIYDSQFEVRLNINTNVALTGVDISAEYDSNLLELTGSVLNAEEIGGIYLDDVSDGVYRFTYMNTQGTDFSGTYSTMTFELLDPEMTSTVIYLKVHSLDDINLRTVSNVTANGIVINRQTVPASAELAEYTQISLPLSEEAVSLGSIGITDVEDVTVTDGQIAIVEDGMLSALAAGETELSVTHSDGSESLYMLTIFDPEQQEEVSENSPANKKAKKLAPHVTDNGSKGMSAAIIIAVAAAIAAIIAEYIIIMKPFEKRKNACPRVYLQDEEDNDDFDEEESGESSGEINTEAAVEAENAEAPEEDNE